MAWDRILTALTYRLADLYFDSEETRLIAQRAGLKVNDITFDRNVRNYWQNILSRADTLDEGPGNHDLIIGLLETVTSAEERGGKDEFLKTVLDNYRTGKVPEEMGRSANTDWQERDSPDQLEKLMGSVSTLQPISFLEQGLVCARSVARIVVGNSIGTGFLVANNYLVTNNHVIPNEAAAATAVVQFNYQQNWLGGDLQFKCSNLNPESGFDTSIPLDYTVVKVEGDVNSTYGQLTFSAQLARKDDFVNIIQHPAGGPKQIALYHNVITFADEIKVQYLTDTLPGSSGSPVFNDKWEVVALHHSGGWIKQPGLSQSVYRNEGINGQRIQEALNRLTT